MAMPAPAPPAPPPPPPPFAGTAPGTHRLIVAKARNFKDNIHHAFNLMTQHPVNPPPAATLTTITNHVHQFLSDERGLTNQNVLNAAQTAYCDYFRQLWLNHNAWWPQCVNAITQLHAMVP